jgi:hypothetical protein
VGGRRDARGRRILHGRQPQPVDRYLRVGLGRARTGRAGGHWLLPRNPAARTHHLLRHPAVGRAGPRGSRNRRRCPTRCPCGHSPATSPYRSTGSFRWTGHTRGGRGSGRPHRPAANTVAAGMAAASVTNTEGSAVAADFWCAPGADDHGTGPVTRVTSPSCPAVAAFDDHRGWPRSPTRPHPVAFVRRTMLRDPGG